MARTSQEWLDAAAKMLTIDEIDLRALAKLAGGNPRTFYRGANLRGADLRGQDLRDMDFTGADLSGIVIDHGTRFGRSLNLMLLGPPGAGKSTQAVHLASAYGLQQLSTGDMLRQAVINATPMGLVAKAIMEAGQLISDANVLKLIEEWLDHRTDLAGVVFDGFPRTEFQAGALDQMLELRGTGIDLVIELEVDEALLIDRITGRFTCAACGDLYHDRAKPPLREGTCDRCDTSEFKRRPDDNEETVRTRMAEYLSKTAPIIPIFEARGIVRRVDATRPIGEVSERIDALLDPLLIEIGRDAARYRG